MNDNIKTIREALDWVATVGDERFADQARAALDSLETELLRRDALHGREVGKLEAELATLRARLAPADSTPGDELAAALRHFENLVVMAKAGYPASWEMDRDDMRHLLPIFAAASAHLRSQQPETEEQRAERLLGEWLVAHPGWTHGREGCAEDDEWRYRIELWRPDDGIDGESGFPPTDWHASEAAAILDALARAGAKP